MTETEKLADSLPTSESSKKRTFIVIVHEYFCSKRRFIVIVHEYFCSKRTFIVLVHEYFCSGDYPQQF